ncbi:HAMP domain-containing histidine kinase [Curvibacter lanceolatus]|jgi:signal transduction histidine kinase|uniref:HAMP domain-containing histidine kinase n=1 Tax=Curvibacter lanceolatus TaxID=86182 RepID=UPI00035D88BD|nr:HAMP domain-containing histidine kinase [Curvibacter lanceolatus]
MIAKLNLQFAAIIRFFFGSGDQLQTVRYIYSIRLRLLVIFLTFLFLVLGVGLVGVYRLSEFNGVSREISAHWLESTRIMGDLNNFISDLRTAEGDLIISPAPRDRVNAVGQFRELDRTVKHSLQEFGRIVNDASEALLYEEFQREWRTYREHADEVVSLTLQGRVEDARNLYRGPSLQAYNIANHSLLQLMNNNIKGARVAVDRQSAAYRQAFGMILMVMFVALFLVLTAIAGFVSVVSKPMLDLVDIMNKIGAGQLQVQVPGLQRRDEMGEMARAVLRFRDNTEELNRSRQILAAQAKRLGQSLDIERRMVALQSDFISTVSHEFRTPLNVIDGHVQRLLRTKDAVDAEVLAARCLKIRSAVSRMTDLIHRLLDSADALELQMPEALQMGAFSLRGMLHELADMYRDSTQPERLIHEDYESGVPDTFRGDERLLSQAVSNLLDNALKYSASPQPVVLRLRANEREFLIEVIDCGIGILDKDRQRIFEQYTRGENANSVAGAGVGLSLVKWVMRLHGGAVMLDSIPGRGATFSLRLPKPPVAGAVSSAPTEGRAPA